MHDSYPNPHLRKDSDSETFQPAWKLQDASYERAGREGNQTRDYKFNGGPTSPPVRHRSRSRPGSEDEGTSAAVVVIGKYDYVNLFVSIQAVKYFYDNLIQETRF